MEEGYYECAERELGEQIWQLDDPNIAPDLRAHLEDHLSICAACRAERALQERLRPALAGGAVTIPSDRAVIRIPRSVGWAGSLALAACLALVFILRPTMPADNRVVRGDRASPGFLRPLPGEVIWGARPVLAWHPIERATAYMVNVREIDGPFGWSSQTDQTSLALPDSVTLPAGARLQAFLEPIPAYLGPPGGVSISFRAGSFTQFVLYRLQRAPFWVWLLGLMGLGGLALSVTSRWMRTVK
jgi:hypothetical protein